MNHLNVFPANNLTAQGVESDDSSQCYALSAPVCNFGQLVHVCYLGKHIYGY